MNYIIKPDEIEKRSFEIITEELGDKKFDKEIDHLVKRVIHTTADFEYADLLNFVNDPIKKAAKLIKEGCGIVSDTNMILNGVNKTALKKTNCSLSCYMSDPDVAEEARKRGVTRAKISMEKALKNPDNKIFLIGNAPTALFTLMELINDGYKTPELIIGVPVGFVGAAESKEKLLNFDISSIVVRGRKGGSTVAVAIANALLYDVVGR